MALETGIILAIKYYEDGDVDSALERACLAIESTARNMYGKEKVGRTEYKECIRNYYWIIEPMMGGGFDPSATTFENLKIIDDRGRLIPNPDLADVIYYIFRCNFAHDKSVPPNYKLLPVTDGLSEWRMGEDILMMPERIIWALLAVSVFAKANSNIRTNTDHWLSWGSETLGLGIHKFIIKNSWGKEDDFKAFLLEKNPNPIVRIKIEGLKNLK